MASPIKVRLNVRAAGGKVVAGVQFENVSDHEQLLYAPSACLSGRVTNDVFDIRGAGGRVPHSGPRVRRRTPVREDFVTLAPGETAATRLELDDRYAFPPEGGTFKVAYAAVHGDATLGDAVFGTRSDVVTVEIPPSKGSAS